ncbi:MAG: hypothetical protein ACRDK4_15310 [Solirubrobacteraceae bacterium]
MPALAPQASVEMDTRAERNRANAPEPSGRAPQARTGFDAPASERSVAVNRLDLLLVALLIAAVATVYALYAVRIGNFQNDEEHYLQLARYVSEHFPGAMWQSSLFTRGTQRLDQIVLALPFGLMRGPGAFELAHAIQSLLFASTALPVFLLARRAGLGRAAGLFAATLAVIVPWAIVSTSFLTESLAYPTYAWTLYATWAAATRPSARNDALALLAFIVAALSRTALLALAPMLPLAVVWHEWGWELRGVRWARRARELPARVCSRHRLLATAVGLAALALLAGQLGLLPGRGTAALAGEYGLPHFEALSALYSRYEIYLSRLVVGSGYLAAALALPWIVATAVRPRDGARHALAVTCALGLAVLMLSLLHAGPDERYVLYGAAPIALGAAGTLRGWAFAPRRSLATALGVIATAAALTVLIADVSWPELTNPFDFFSYPAAIFYRRAALDHLVSLQLPLLHSDPQPLVYFAILAIACTFAALSLTRRAARSAAALLALGLVAACATQTIYAFKKFSQTAGAASGPNAAERSWVDRTVPGNAQVGALAISMGLTFDYLPIWRASEFWNISVHYDSFIGTPGFLPFAIGSEARPLTLLAPSGLLRASSDTHSASPQLVPRYMLLPQQGTNSFGLDAKLVASDPYLPLELVRLAWPPRVDWSIGGTSPEGFMPTGAPATVTLYSGAFAGGGRHCASFSLIPPPETSRPWSYRVSGGGRTLAAGTIAGSRTAKVSVALKPVSSPNGKSAELAIQVEGRTVTIAGAQVTTKLAFFSVGRCPATHRATAPSHR